jgi:hypothetical protein
VLTSGVIKTLIQVVFERLFFEPETAKHSLNLRIRGEGIYLLKRGARFRGVRENAEARRRESLGIFDF